MLKIRNIKRVLDEYSIDELRMLGKNLGVKSPTGMTKEDLAVRVLTALRIRNKEKLLETRGRPNDLVTESLDNMATDIDQLLDSGVLDEEEDDSNVYTYEPMNTSLFSTARLSANVKNYEVVADEFEIMLDESERNPQSQIQEDKGYIDERGGAWFIILEKNQGMTSITKSQMDLYGIEHYDSIEFTALHSGIDHQIFLLEILKVNGKDVAGKIKRTSFKNLLSEVPAENFNFKKCGEFLSVLTSVCEIPKGGRVLMSSKQENLNINEIRDIISSFEAINVSTFTIFIDKLNEAPFIAGELGGDVLYVSQSDTPETKCEKILNKIIRASKFVECGYDAVLIINDFDAVYDILSSIITDENPNYITSITTKFFNIGGKFNNNGTLTIFGFVGKNNLRLIERLKRSSLMFVPIAEEGRLELSAVETRLSNFYMDAEAVSVAEDIKKVVVSKGKARYKDLTNTITALRGKGREEVLKAIYNLSE